MTGFGGGGGECDGGGVGLVNWLIYHSLQSLSGKSHGEERKRLLTQPASCLQANKVRQE